MNNSIWIFIEENWWLDNNYVNYFEAYAIMPKCWLKLSLFGKSLIDLNYLNS